MLKGIKNFCIVFVIAFCLFVITESFRAGKLQAFGGCAGGVCMDPFSIARGVNDMAKQIGDAIKQATEDTVEGSAEVFEDFHEQHQDAVRADSAQQRQEEMATKSLETDIANVKAAHEYQMAQEEMNNRIALSSPPPSQLVCRDVEMAKMRASSRRGAAAQQAMFSESSRNASARTGKSAFGGEGTGLPASYDGCSTPLQCLGHQWQINALDCNPDEHEGATAAFCVGRTTDADLAPRDAQKIAEQGLTLRDKESNRVVLSLTSDYQAPAMVSSPLRENCLGNDPNCNQFYYDHLRARAREAMLRETVVDGISDRMEPPRPQPSSVGPLAQFRDRMFALLTPDECQKMKALHNRFDGMEGIDPDPNRACPSVAEVEDYEARMADNPRDLNALFSDFRTNAKLYGLSLKAKGVAREYKNYMKTERELLLMVLGVQE